MKKISLSFSIYWVLVFFICSSFVGGCKKGITDFVKAIDSYSYKSTLPIDTKKIPVDQTLLGAYVYQDLPMIISKKDATTYSINFLSMKLDGEDKIKDAHMSIVNGSKYLNISLDGTYAFFKVSSFLNDQLGIKMVGNRIDVEEKDFKNWLKENGDKEYYYSKDSSKIYIYHEFVLNKIPVERAYSLQTRKLKEEKENLFIYCKKYDCYNDLVIRYPNDPMLSITKRNILNNCKTKDAIQLFITTFPNDSLIVFAKDKLLQIEQLEKDSIGFTSIQTSNEIVEIEKFKKQCKTSKYSDQAALLLRTLALSIKESDIEWKWSTGKKEEALSLLKYKITYCPNSYDESWYLSHLAIYSMKIKSPETVKGSMEYLDVIAAQNPKEDTFLDLYLFRGLLLWNNGDTDSALEIFRLKSKESYLGTKMGFIKQVIIQEKILSKEGIVFPKDKEMLKTLKKMQQ